ncbi:MAG: helix-turn-helix domain-containing protein [Deltaproteobacteria bacterium]|nr:helix-turn-helix domain-containing protein [Deltaproteobacteria bacterium]
MERGFIKVWRKALESRAFQNESLWKIWCWCLLKASHKRRWMQMKTGKGTVEVEIHPGQFIFGRDSAARELHMKPSTVRNRMKKLKKMGNLDIKSDSQFSVVSVMNWHTFQVCEKGKDSKEDNQRTGRGQAGDTDKKVKKQSPKGNESNGEAVSLYQTYLSFVKPKNKTRHRCLSNLDFFLNHYSSEDLQSAIRNYAKTVQDRDPVYRKNPANFFGKQDRYFVDFLPENQLPEEEGDPWANL